MERYSPLPRGIENLIQKHLLSADVSRIEQRGIRNRKDRIENTLGSESALYFNRPGGRYM